METTEPPPCPVIDFATYAARRRRALEPDIYAADVRDALLDDVRDELLDDLATWPPVFQRRLRAGIERQTRETDPAMWLERSFHRDRAAGHAAGDGLGRWTFDLDGFLGVCLHRLRKAAAAVRAATTRRSRARCRRSLADCKADLLELLWQHGQPRIDRTVQAAHAVAYARAECDSLAAAIRAARGDSFYYATRLVENRTLEGARKGRPLSERTRCEFRRRVVKAERDMAEHTARRVLLLELLDDVPALVRELTGCRRG